MSSIKDLLNQEKEAEGLLKDADQKAEAVLREAKAKASDMIRRAQSDDALVRELTERNKAKIAEIRASVLSECEARAAQTEGLCRKNLEAAVRVVVNDVRGGEE